MEAVLKVQLSNKQVAKLEAGGVVAIAASWDDFMEFLPETCYRAEYHNGQIIIMGLAAFYHEVLIMAVGDILRRLLKGKGYFVAGSNVGISKEEGKGITIPISQSYRECQPSKKGQHPLLRTLVLSLKSSLSQRLPMILIISCVNTRESSRYRK